LENPGKAGHLDAWWHARGNFGPADRVIRKFSIIQTTDVSTQVALQRVDIVYCTAAHVDSPS
jgi:hypothetical protein